MSSRNTSYAATAEFRSAWTGEDARPHTNLPYACIPSPCRESNDGIVGGA
jgi:hypothetical protein